MMSSGSTETTNEREQLVERMQFLGQMLSTETAHFLHTIAIKQNISITDSKTVSTLMQEGPMTAGQLADRLSLTTGAVTSLIDRLEQCGIVNRAADPSDRRKVLVVANGKKIKEFSKDYQSIHDSFNKVLNTYSLDELRFLIDYYQSAIELTKQETKKVTEKQ